MKGSSRAAVSLYLFLAIGVMIVTGILAFLRPFSLTVVSLHTIFGLSFALAVFWHLRNNLLELKHHLRTKTVLVCVIAGIALAVAVFAEVPPVPALMSLSSNSGPEPTELVDDREQFTFTYEATKDYIVELTVRKGPTFTEPPPRMAIWLENKSAFHIHTLHATEEENLGELLPYWNDKRQNWQKAKDKFEAKQELDVDAVSEPTINASFDPADYLLPDTGAYFVLLEISAPGMDTSAFDSANRSLVYSAAIDNAKPAHFQLMRMLGLPVEDKEEEKWKISYDLSSLSATKELIDSILVTIHRKSPGEK